MISALERIIEPKKRFTAGARPFDNAALWGITLPLLIEMLSKQVVGLADTLMVSYAGEATVSGVSLDTMVVFIFTYLFTAVSTGGAVVVSQYLGNKGRDNAQLAAGQIFHIDAILSVVCMAVMLPFGDTVLRWLYGSVDPDVMEACKIYLRIVTLSFPANALYNAGAALYRSMGMTRATMYVSVGMNLVNVVGNAIGVFVLHAGAAGVAWPTTISWYFAAITMTILCMNKQNTVFLRLKKALVLHRQMALRILRIAIPNGIEDGLFQLAKVALSALVATFGTVQIAANGISQTIWNFSGLVNLAMAPVFITVVGQCMGAGDADAADYYMRKLTRLTLVLTMVWNLGVMLITPAILPLYDVSYEAKELIFITVMIHAVFASFVQPISLPLSGGLRATGDVKFVMFTSLFCTVFLRTALSFLFGMWLGWEFIGVTLAMVTDWVCRAIMNLVRYRGGKWRNFKVI